MVMGGQAIATRTTFGGGICSLDICRTATGGPTISLDVGATGIVISVSSCWGSRPLDENEDDFSGLAFVGDFGDLLSFLILLGCPSVASGL